MAIIAAKDIHVVFVDHRGVRMTRAWTLLGVDGLELLPCAELDVVAVEIVDSVVAVISTEDVNAATMDDSRVSIPRAGRLRAPIGIELTPRVRGEVKAVEVIAAIGPIVASENVKVVVHSD